MTTLQIQIEQREGVETTFHLSAKTICKNATQKEVQLAIELADLVKQELLAANPNKQLN